MAVEKKSVLFPTGGGYPGHLSVLKTNPKILTMCLRLLNMSNTVYRDDVCMRIFSWSSQAAGGSSIFLENIALTNGSATSADGGGGVVKSDGDGFELRVRPLY